MQIPFPYTRRQNPVPRDGCVHLDCLPPKGCFEITEVSEDSISFVVPGGYLDSGKNEVHSLPLRNGFVSFEHTEEKKTDIEGSEYNYEEISEMVVSTSRQLLNIHACATGKGVGKETIRSFVQIPFAPGEYELGANYPFTKNVYTSGDSGYSFGRLSVLNDSRILYLGDFCTIIDEMVEKKECINIVKGFDDETIEITIFATPKAF